MKHKESNQTTEQKKEAIIQLLSKDFVDGVIQIFSDAKNNIKTKNKIIKFSQVSPEQAQKLREKTGLELEGYSHQINSDSIRHILKEHGNEQLERFRGQVAITERDILRIPEIVKDFDDVMNKGRNKKGEQSLLYRKKIGNDYFYVETVSRKNKTLNNKTMWIRKIKG
jgi:hypothetical protein